MSRPGQSLLSRLSFSSPPSGKNNILKGNIHAQTLLNILSRLKSGHLSLRLPNGETQKFGNPSDALCADIQIHDWSVI